ncbi:MAG: aspartyl/asparaginyl beta-hydroxylase domain-containing protein [Mycobacteriales bacterium]
MLSALRLPLAVDVSALAADVAGLRPDDWVPHFNDRYYEGDWSGAALRAIGGDASQIHPDPSRTDFGDTEVLARCPGATRLLDSLGSPALSARFLRLGPGSRIREHTDYNLSFEDGEVRLHMPVSSSADVEFHLDGELVEMAPGECWYLNVNLPHRVRNAGSSPRVHLVVDVVVDEWLRDLVERAQVSASRDPS